MRVIEVNMERRRNEEAGETGDPQENPVTNGIVRQDFHLRKSGDPAEVEPAQRQETGDPRENPPTSGIVRHDSHLRKSRVNLPGIEPSSPWWEASSLTGQPPLPQVLQPHMPTKWGRRLATCRNGACQPEHDDILASQPPSRVSEEIWTALNIEVLRADEGRMRRECSIAGMLWRGKREIPEKIRISPRCSHLPGTLKWREQPSVENSVAKLTDDSHLAMRALMWEPQCQRRRGIRDSALVNTASRPSTTHEYVPFPYQCTVTWGDSPLEASRCYRYIWKTFLGPGVSLYIRWGANKYSLEVDLATAPTR
ncbi:hypothetical protein PR048_013782 [Dryococelus australis]|uniref:Uncharacterized protein n=1 Tax=Dryococelus australis TaxID=614101 RepID=A0ABQ9HT51_9NEOP|nr:hypothetical protein PR048_013782 [Dryococelus australis]